MEMTRNAISWVEIPVADFERARSFYSRVFDYEMPDMQMGPVRMGFLLYDQENGGIGGAIVHGEGCGEPGTSGPRVYLDGGEDLGVPLGRVESAGGKIVMPKTQITPELGFFASFQDSEGNLISLHSMS